MQRGLLCQLQWLYTNSYAAPFHVWAILLFILEIYNQHLSPLFKADIIGFPIDYV